MTTWTIKSKAVNSKLLYDDVIEFVEGSLNELGMNWSSAAQRESYVELLEDYFHELVSNNRIEQYDVKCDLRNNKLADMNDGHFVLDLLFRQRHCLNVTQIRFQISTKHQMEIWDIPF